MPATYDSIATTTLGSAGIITLSSIPSTYTDLRVVIVGSNVTFAQGWSMRFNGDTGTNYSTTLIHSNGSNIGSSRQINATSIFIGDYVLNNDTVTTLCTVDVFGYSGSTFKETLHNEAGDKNGAGTTIQGVGLWRNTAAINSITIRNDGGNNLAAGTRVTLYGIKAA